jgi:hypothetical protein
VNNIEPHHGGFHYSKTFKIWNSRYSSFISISSKFELELNLTFRRKILLWYFCLANHHHHHQSDCNFKGPLIPSVEPFKAQFASKRSCCSVQKVLCVVIVLFFSFVCFSFVFLLGFWGHPLTWVRGHMIESDTRFFSVLKSVWLPLA